MQERKYSGQPGEKDRKNHVKQLTRGVQWELPESGGTIVFSIDEKGKSSLNKILTTTSPYNRIEQPTRREAILLLEAISSQMPDSPFLVGLIRTVSEQLEKDSIALNDDLKIFSKATGINIYPPEDAL
jgi:hypothetical protein